MHSQQGNPRLVTVRIRAEGHIEPPHAVGRAAFRQQDETAADEPLDGITHGVHQGVGPRSESVGDQPSHQVQSIELVAERGKRVEGRQQPVSTGPPEGCTEDLG